MSDGTKEGEREGGVRERGGGKEGEIEGGTEWIEAGEDTLEYLCIG